MKRAAVSVILALALSCGGGDEPLVQRIEIGGWEFRERAAHATNQDDGGAGGPGSGLIVSDWLPATVPGTVHTDLLNSGLIPDPFYGCSENDLQWIGERDWSYRVAFEVDRNLLAQSNVELVFEGLDTYAEVFLNGRRVISADNMFRRWEAGCREILRPGRNELKVSFASACRRFSADSLALGYPLPGGRWVFARKAAYHFGWDWGPRFVTAGIWRPVYLRAWDRHKPLDMYIRKTDIKNTSADLEAVIEVRSTAPEQAKLRVIDSATGRLLAERRLALAQGRHEYRLGFSIPDPVLWWCNGLGEPHIYDLYIELETAAGKTYAREIPFGIRTLEVVMEDDEHGRALYIVLNGAPVFIKGANHIPLHSFPPEVRDDQYRELVRAAAASNMNMLRVWGGGIYERDIFYEECNRAGLLVWQDFMFACAMYPAGDEFIESVGQEATEQVRRLRRHTNLALWCGNNEIDEGWHNWGWQRAYDLSPADSAAIWDGYLRLFHGLLPAVVASHDSGRFYLPTTPLYGWGREESLREGSAHYWGVWWGRKPFEAYIEHVPRFMSEYGLQALPALATIRGFQPPEEDYLISPSLACHQKHPTGFETMDLYLEREVLRPRSLVEYIHHSQLVQALGVGLAIEAHRRSRPRCMGSLYWQLGDCWPVVSWSGIDACGNWKALQYRVRELYDQIMVSVIARSGEVEVYLVSDRLRDTRGALEVCLIDFSGRCTEIITEHLTLPAATALPVSAQPVGEFFRGADPARNLVEAVFTTEDGERYANRKFLAPLGALRLPAARPALKIETAPGGFTVTVSTDSLAAYVQLYLTESPAWFDKNFFHLFPGEPARVFCRTDLAREDFLRQLSVFHLGAGNEPSSAGGAQSRGDDRR